PSQGGRNNGVPLRPHIALVFARRIRFTAKRSRRRSRRWGMSNMNYTIETVALAVGAFLALLGVAFAHDSQFAAHMWVLFFTLMAATVVMVRRVSFVPMTAAQKA